MNSRVQIDPLICHGKPVIKNTRVLISNILSDLASGASDKEIIENYPSLTNEDIKAALDFGSELANFECFTYESQK
jgi:uncharacterized protein (DUF433 family)